MEPTAITVRAQPDALVKVYDETRDEVLYIDNTNQDGETTPIILPSNGGHYYFDVTIFPDLTVSNE